MPAGSRKRAGRRPAPGTAGDFTADLQGRQFLLRGEDMGSLDIGSPIYFRKIQVGQVVGYDLDPDGKGVTVKVFVNAPYDKHVNTNTRFWYADGFDDADVNGLKISTNCVGRSCWAAWPSKTIPRRIRRRRPRPMPGSRSLPIAAAP